MKNYDFIIVGTGIVGLAFAAMIAERTSLSILILESRADFPTWEESAYSARVSAINLASVQLLINLDVWETIKAHRISPFQGIAVWLANEKAQIEFMSEAIGKDYLGYIIENSLIHKALLEKVSQQQAITIKLNTTLDQIIYYDDRIEITDAAHECYRGRCLVAADGSQSWVRNYLKIECQHKNYHEHAVVSHVRTALSHDQIARQVFLPTGPLAFLPLAEQTSSSIVWTLPSDRAHEIKKLSPQEFCRTLGEAFPYLGKIESMTEALTFPLHMQQAKRFIDHRTVLIGDAAHSVHPLAGLGVNMGLLDAGHLADIIIAAHLNHEDFASKKILRRYERLAKAMHWPLMIGIHTLHTIFQKSSFIIKLGT